MNTRTRTYFQTALILVAFTLSPQPVAPAQDVSSLEFGVLKESYEKKLEELAAEIREKEIAPLLEKYDAALARAEDVEAAAGRLGSVVAIRAERERAKNEAGITEAQISKDEPAIATLQRQLLKKLGEISVGQQGQCNKVADIYAAKLKELKLRLTRQKRIDQAIAVDDELKRIEKERQKQAGSKTDFFVQEEEDDRSRFLGEWIVTRYDGFDLCQAKIAKAGKGKVEIISDNKWLKGMVGEYLVDGTSLRKVRKDGDLSWDIVWQPDKREFLSIASHFPKYRLSRVKAK